MNPQTHTPERWKKGRRKPCPNCGSKTGWNETVSDGFGKCFACDYKEKLQAVPTPTKKVIAHVEPTVEPKAFDNRIYTAATRLDNYQNNAFAVWLKTTFNIPFEFLATVGVGTARNNETVFFSRSPDWKDTFSAKIVRYCPNGKRDKTFGARRPVGFQDKDGYPVTLFFAGLFNPELTTILVESEKTAVLCKFFFPNRNWLAVGGASGLTRLKIRQLKEVCQKIFVCFDNDASGQKNQPATIEKLKAAGLRAFALPIGSLWPDLPDKADLADVLLLIKEKEKEAQKTALQGRSAAIDEKVNTYLNDPENAHLKWIFEGATNETIFNLLEL